MRRIPFAVRLLLEGAVFMVSTVLLMEQEGGRVLLLLLMMAAWGRWRFNLEIKRDEHDTRMIAEQSLREWDINVRDREMAEVDRSLYEWQAFMNGPQSPERYAQYLSNSLLNMRYTGLYDGRLANQTVMRTDPEPTPPPSEIHPPPLP